MQVKSQCFCTIRACIVSVGCQGVVFIHFSVFPQFPSVLVSGLLLWGKNSAIGFYVLLPLSEDAVSREVYCAVVSFFPS